jgi:hypothetical protein
MLHSVISQNRVTTVTASDLQIIIHFLRVVYVFYPRPFSVQKIPRSNLILLVVDTLCPCGSKQLSITPQEVVYESMQGVAVTTQCRIKPQEMMYRRRPPKCMNYHPEVSHKTFNIDPI